MAATKAVAMTPAQAGTAADPTTSNLPAATETTKAAGTTSLLEALEVVTINPPAVADTVAAPTTKAVATTHLPGDMVVGTISLREDRVGEDMEEEAMINLRVDRVVDRVVDSLVGWRGKLSRRGRVT